MYIKTLNYFYKLTDHVDFEYICYLENIECVFIAPLCKI